MDKNRIAPPRHWRSAVTAIVFWAVAFLALGIVSPLIHLLLVLAFLLLVFGLARKVEQDRAAKLKD